MSTKDNNVAFVAGLLIWFCAIAFILIIPSQSDFNLLAIGFPLAFCTYFFFIWSKPNHEKIKWCIIAGVAVRIVSIFFFPKLSDDIFRFIWDGRIIHNGLQPYAYLPIDIVKQIPSLANGDILTKMNSPEYYTVYPPVGQLVFWLSSWLGLSVEHSSFIMKLIFFLTEIVTLLFSLKILKHLNINSSAILIYWLNPLIIVEGLGNLHLEIVMISFLAVALYYWLLEKHYPSIILLALSVGAKLLSLLILPYLLWKVRWKKSFALLGVFIFAMLIVFSPLLLGLNYTEFLSSIDLYFRKFEFNAGLYYLLRWIGFQISGYNLIAYIGPFLGLTFIISVFYFTTKEIAKSAFSYLFVILIVYLLLATTIHPWYLSIPLFCSIFVRSKIAIVWSALIWLTYSNYSFSEYQENLVVVTIEYAIVFGYILYEWKNVSGWLRLRNPVDTLGN